VSLLEPGLEYLRRRTGKPVLGVVPYLPKLRIADEDSVSLEDRDGRRRAERGELEISVVRLPRISNYDDVQPLEHEAGVVVRFVESPEELTGTDLVILPGSKNTASDLGWLRARGLAAAIEARARSGQPVLGVCGGCQMLGRAIEDPLAVESPEQVTPGLGLLPLTTRFERSKTTAQVTARAGTASFLTAGTDHGLELHGYEIHMGVVTACARRRPAFEIVTRGGQSERSPDGACDERGMVVGTMLHGLFENAALRAGMLRALRARRGLADRRDTPCIPAVDAEYDRLEAALRAHVDRDLLWRISGIGR
jgi:adenosylcobyric acid synthase